MKDKQYESPEVEVVALLCEELVAISFSGTTGDLGDSTGGDSFEDIIVDNPSSWD